MFRCWQGGRIGMRGGWPTRARVWCCGLPCGLRLVQCAPLVVHAGRGRVNPRVHSLLFRMDRSLWEHAYVALLPNTDSIRICTFRHQLLLLWETRACGYREGCVTASGLGDLIICLEDQAYKWSDTTWDTVIQQHTEFGKYLWDNTLFHARKGQDRKWTKSVMLLCNLLKEREESSGASRENPMSTCKMLVKNVWFIQESVINLVWLNSQWGRGVEC